MAFSKNLCGPCLVFTSANFVCALQYFAENISFKNRLFSPNLIIVIIFVGLMFHITSKTGLYRGNTEIAVQLLYFVLYRNM